MQEQIGNNLRKIRLSKGVKQDVIAKSLGIHVSTYGKLERNEIQMNIDTLKKISEILDEPLENFLETKNNYEIKNGNNSPLALNMSNSTLNTVNEKLIDTHIKISEAILTTLNNQTELMRELTKLIKSTL